MKHQTPTFREQRAVIIFLNLTKRGLFETATFIERTELKGSGYYNYDYFVVLCHL